MKPIETFEEIRSGDEEDLDKIRVKHHLDKRFRINREYEINFRQLADELVDACMKFHKGARLTKKEFADFAELGISYVTYMKMMKPRDRRVFIDSAIEKETI